MNHKLLCTLSLVCASAVCQGRLDAIPSDETVQKNAQDVFSRPEFARLKKLQRSELVREDLSRDFPKGEGADGPQNRHGNGRNDRQGNGPGDGRPNGRGDRRVNDQDGDNKPRRNRRNADNPPPRRERTSVSPTASFGDFGAGMAGFFKLLGMLAIAVMIAAIVILLVKSLQDRDSRLEQELTGTLHSDVGELEADHPPSEYPADEYLRRAAQCAKQGDYREAVALVLLGAMSEVERRGFIRYRKGLTQRDYYRTVRRHERIGPAYRHILRIYEPLGFGRRTAELQHYQTAVKSFRGGFRDRAAFSEV